MGNCKKIMDIRNALSELEYFIRGQEEFIR
jgi:hypothetical protein